MTDAAPPSDPEDMTRRCPDCAHENPSEHRFCEACGAALGAADREGGSDAGNARSGRRPHRGVATTDDRVEKARARAEFARTKAVAFRLRNVYVVGILVAISQLALFWKLGQMGLEDHVVWTCYAVFGTSLLVKVVGAILVLRRPLIWAVVVAVEQSVVFGLVLWLDSAALVQVIHGFFFVVFWATVVSAAKLQRVLDEHPELALKRGKIDRERVREGGVSDRARGMRRQSRAAVWRMVGIGLAVVAAVVALVVILNLPPGLSGREEVFRRVWTAGKADGFDRHAVRSMQRTLARAFAERGWDEAMPDLGACEINEEETSGTMTFAIERGEVEVAWGYDERVERWLILTINLPAVDYAPFEPFAERFVVAWEGTGGDGILGLFGSDRLRKSLTRVLEKQGWWSERPRVRERAVSGSGGRRTLELEVADGFVTSRWRYRHPDWVVTGLGLP